MNEFLDDNLEFKKSDETPETTRIVRDEVREQTQPATVVVEVEKKLELCEEPPEEECRKDLYGDAEVAEAKEIMQETTALVRSPVEIMKEPDSFLQAKSKIGSKVVDAVKNLANTYNSKSLWFIGLSHRRPL